VRTKPRHSGIDAAVTPSGTGCVECMQTGGWWLHLRRCTQCGHIGCCDDSPSQHATKHYHSTGHPIIASFEPGEEWFYNYELESAVEGVTLARRAGILRINRFQALLAGFRRTGNRY
jgi:hypothetical protein